MKLACMMKLIERGSNMATLQEILAARKLPELMTMNDGGAVAE
ncbi:MAG: hypothetical protein ACLSB9_03115 [Hydrogeniiclostridium mannosilyticum]